MRKDDRKQLPEEFARELLDAALANCRVAEPRDGLEERVLVNLRQQARVAPAVSWSWAPVMIAAAAVLMFLAADHLLNPAAVSEPAISAVAKVSETRDGVRSHTTAARAQADATGDVAKSVKPPKAFVGARPLASSSRRQDLALNRPSSRADEQVTGSFQVAEVRITEVRLDEIVIGNNERQE